MTRKRPEWSKGDDVPIPPRIKLRVRARANQCCQNCGIRVGHGGEIDHALAIILGGKNCESNLRFLCKNCHAAKTKTDVALKSRAAKTQRSVAGFETVSPFRQLREKLNLKWNWKTRRYERILPEATNDQDY